MGKSQANRGTSDLRRSSPISEKLIRDALRAFYKINSRFPTANSREPVPGMRGESWKAIDSACRQGLRGLPGGSSLSKLIEPLRKSLGLGRSLTEEEIVEASRKFFELHRRLPNSHSRDPVPGRREDSWAAINMAGYRGNRGLKKGRILAVILKDLRHELGLDRTLSEEAIIMAAKIFFDLYGKFPNCNTREPVPTLPKNSWAGINQAGRDGRRGLRKGRTLYKILLPLKRELGLTRN